MSRAPLVNPVVPGEGNEELYRSFGTLIDQLERHFNRSGQIFTATLLDVVSDLHVYLIPRVGRNGFQLGRVSITLLKNAPDPSDLDASASDYWTFTLYRYFTATDGTRTSRPIPGGTWNTSTTAIRLDIPKVVVLKRPLDPGDTLVLEIDRTGAAAAFSATVQIEETFGPEE